MRRLLVLLLCSLASLFALVALASPTFAAPDSLAVVTTPPIGEGEPFIPGVRLVADLPESYVEEELFIEGLADIYSYEDPAVRGEVVVIQEDVPYKTRMIVRRPTGYFNGTVVIEWWNTTATFDTAPVWDPSAEYFARNGYIYIGFTNANQGLTHLTSGCRLFGILPPTCGTRYSSLSMPDDGLAYDIASQLANLVKTQSDDNPLYPDYKVTQVMQAGQSQQGGSMIAYANNFHTDVNDGYFVQSASGGRSVCGTGNVLPPGCNPQATDRSLRRDLPVPVYRMLTENDVDRNTNSAQEDDGLFRYYEVAGVSHVHVHEDVELIPGGVLGPDPLFLEDACLFPPNTAADGPVLGSHNYNAMWHNMLQTIRDGTPAPHAPLIDRDGAGEIVRDEFGNATGGISPTMLRVPRATYGPQNEPDVANLPGPLILLGNLFCFLSGTVAEFDEETLAELYPQHYLYVGAVKQAGVQLMQDGFLLGPDFQKELATARALNPDPKCGLGFELVAVLPPLLWAARRRRGGRARRSS